MNVAILRHPGGNVQSVLFAMERLGVTCTVSDNPEILLGADKVLFPGVGEASTTMNYLRHRKLDQLICSLTQPVLGICLGMQLLCSRSEENETKGMGVFDIDVLRFAAKPLKVPHMGWNKLHSIKDWIDPQLQGSFSYFVHSYYVPVNPFTVAQATYGQSFSAALRKDNFFAVQFHPEKSGETGALILKNFLDQSSPG